MRNRKGLVQVDVADIGAVVAGPRQPHLGIEVCPIEIDQPAMSMHDLADFANLVFEDPVRRRIGDHHRRELVSVLLGLRAQVVEVEVGAL